MEKIYFDSEKAVAKEQVTVWKSAKGNYFFDEQSARMDGSTHVKCSECGLDAEKPYYKCSRCRDIAAKERYNARDKKEWDGFSLLYSDAAGVYFQDLDEVYDYCYHHDCSIDDLMVLICEAWYPSKINYDYWSDELPEDGDLPEYLMDAVDKLNKVIDDNREPLAWYPSKYALAIPESAVNAVRSEE